jgi:hypothetical protein
MGMSLQICEVKPNGPESYYRARYYDAATGRFLVEDPLGFIANSNFYVYVASNPVNARDSFGLWSPEAHDKILAYSLAGCASDCDIKRIQAASRSFDNRTGGGRGFSPVHSMRAPWQSPSQALRIRDQFIQITLAQASAAQQAGLDGQALDLLGEAVHPIMDSTSLIHTDSDGNPLPWDDLGNHNDYFHSPFDGWGAETSNMLALDSPRFKNMEQKIRYAYIKVRGKCALSN